MAGMRMLRVPLAGLAIVALVALALAPAEPEPLLLDRGASGLGLALRRVGTIGRVLYVTAHPDDEHNGVLVRLSRGLGLRTALLTVTRGEGGQNAIGPELGDALGVLRTEELMALHRYDGVEQYFGHAVDFGYSFSVEETFERWGREETLGDVVRVVRLFRPDVMLTLPLEGTGGGQHHQAAARLALQAFRAAADPRRFPEQVQAGLRPWQARKIYRGGIGGFSVPLPGSPVRVPTGVFDPVLGLSWQQLGSLARSMHRCQGVGQLVADPGSAEALFALLDSEPSVEGVEADLLDGIDTTLGGLARFLADEGAMRYRLAALDEAAATARRAFDARSPGTAAPALTAYLGALRETSALIEAEVAGARRAEALERLAEEAADVERALGLAHGLRLEARVGDGLVVPGQSLAVEVLLANGGAAPVEVDSARLAVPEGWRAEASDEGAATLAAGAVLRRRLGFVVGEDASPSRPYWRHPPGRDRHELLDPTYESLPWAPPDVVARVRCRIAGVALSLEAPAVHRYAGPFVGGEKRHVVQVLPALSLRLEPELTVLPIRGPRSRIEVKVHVTNNAPGPTDAVLRLRAPAAFRIEPEEATLRLGHEGQSLAARFFVQALEPLTADAARLEAVAVAEGREHALAVQEIAYDHIQRRQRVSPAQARLLALDVTTASGASVGYVMGPGDPGAEALGRLGVPVRLLEADDLAFGDLSRFTTIVTGIRAYETRADLRSHHARLLRFMEEGGHLVVQYNRDAFNYASPDAAPSRRLVPGPPPPSPFAPYPAAVTPARITDETAAVVALLPEHPLLGTPNRIGPADWEGWVQERAIQLLDARDPRYVELLASSDPFPYNPGEKRGLLVEARVGKGTWTYVGLVLFRQLPTGVPGAWRLLANLVSRPRESDSCCSYVSHLDSAIWRLGKRSEPIAGPSRPRGRSSRALRGGGGALRRRHRFPGPPLRLHPPSRFSPRHRFPGRPRRRRPLGDPSPRHRFPGFVAPRSGARPLGGRPRGPSRRGRAPSPRPRAAAAP
jgi:LmbE family N-acetylglucosaminyl deacetylase